MAALERITDISQLSQGDKIFRITPGDNVEILEFREIHPHNNKYSLFLNQNKDGMPKFWNGNLQTFTYYRYSDSKETWEQIYQIRIENLERDIQDLKARKEDL